MSGRHNDSTPRPRTGIVRSSSAVGCIVAPTSTPSRAATAINTAMKTINNDYKALADLLRTNELMPIIKSAPPYEPPPSVAQGFKNYDRWSWFCDYIACKVTGGYGLFGMLDAEALKREAGSIATQIDAQRNLFKEYKSLLTDAQKTSDTPRSAQLDEALAAFDTLEKSVLKLRHMAADISEGRVLESTARQR